MSIISLLSHLNMCSSSSLSSTITSTASDMCSSSSLSSTVTSTVSSQTTTFRIKQIMQIQMAKNIKKFCTEYYTMQTHPERIDLLFKGMFYQEEHAKRLLALSQNKCLTKLNQVQVCINFAQLTHSGAYYHGYAPNDLFEIPDDKKSPTGKKVMHYTLKKECTPSHALERVLNLKKGEIFFVDCTLVCSLTFFKALQEIIPNTFDGIFGSDSPLPFSLEAQGNCPLWLLSTRIPGHQVENFEVGDWAYFENIEKYRSKHFNGSTVGMNAICISKTPTFTGFGLDPKGVTQQEIEKLLLEEYNSVPAPTIGMPEIVKDNQAQMALGSRRLQNDTIKSIEEFKNLGGGRLLAVRRITFERIAQLADSTVEQGRQLLRTWSKEQ